MVIRTHNPPLRRHVLFLCVVAIALAGSACDRNRILEWAVYGSGRRLDKEMVALERANRIVVVKSGSSGRDPLATIGDQAKVRDVVAFFKRYPDRWILFSGPPGDYWLYVYQDDRDIGLLALTASSRVRPGEDTLTFGEYARRAPSADVAALVSRLGLPWPPR